DLGQHRVQGLRLRHRSRKAVHDEPLLRIVLLEPIPDQLDHEVVGDEVAALEDWPHPLAELVAVGDRLAQHLPRRDVREAMLGGDALCLRPLPRPLDAEKQDVERYLRKPSYERIIICDSIWRIVSRATPT